MKNVDVRNSESNYVELQNLLGSQTIGETLLLPVIEEVLFTVMH